MSLSQRIRRAHQTRWCVRFKTDHPHGDSLDGVVTHIGRDFVAICEEVGFRFDGVVILPSKVIRKIRDGKYERCRNAILQHNGAIEQLEVPEWINRCDNLRAVLEELRTRDIWPAVEIVFDRGRRNALYLGPITRTTAKHFFIWCYDAAGRWEKEYRLTYKEIFKVEVEASYGVHFNAYMRTKSAPN